MKDFVKCSNCEVESYVGVGENVCPRCGMEGVFQWATLECDICEKIVEPQEVEGFIDKSQGLRVYVCDSCVKEQEQLEDYYESILDKRIK